MSLIKNTAVYTIGTVLPKIGSFIFLPIYLSFMSPAEYGIISSLYILNTVLLLLFTLSIPKALYRLYYDDSDDLYRKRLIGTSFLTIIASSFTVLISILLLNNFVSKIFQSIPFYPYFLYLTFTVFFLGFHSLPLTLLQIREKSGLFMALTISLFFLKNLSILILVVAYKLGAEGYLLGDLITDALFLPVLYFCIRKDISIEWDKRIFQNLLSFSLPIMPGILSSWVLNLSDRMFIERYFSTTEVGIYSLGYQIAGLCLLFTSAFKSAYDPYFYKLANEYSDLNAKNKLYRTNYIFVVLLLIVTFLIALFSRDLVSLIFSSVFLESSKVVPIVVLGYFFSQNSALLNNMIYQFKKSNVITYIYIVTAVINIALNLLLIPAFGIIGAAWATTFSFFSVFVFTYMTARRYYFIPYNWQIIAPLFFTFLIGFLVTDRLEFSSVISSILFKIGLIIIISILIYFRNKKVILELIRSL